MGGGNILTKIVLPSILFSALSYFPKSIIKGGSIDVQSFVFETIGGCTYWFTSALVIAQLIFLIALTSKSRNIWLYAVIGIISAVIGKLMYEYHINFFEGSNCFPWMYKQGLICALYFSGGGVYIKYESAVNKMIPPIITAILALFYLVTIIFFYNDMECTTSMCMIDVLGAVVSFIGCILLIRICKCIPKNFVLDFIGNQSLGFYFLSGAIPLMLSILTTRYIGNANYGSLTMVFILSIVISWIIVKAILRYIPWILNFKLLTFKKDSQR